MTCSSLINLELKFPHTIKYLNKNLQKSLQKKSFKH